jgi:putative flippase GtrA
MKANRRPASHEAYDIDQYPTANNFKLLFESAGERYLGRLVMLLGGLNLSRELIRFVIVGITNATITYLTFILFIRFLPSSSYQGGIAQALSYACGILWSYFFNRRWTFKSSGDVRSEFFRFLVIQVSLLFASSLLIHLFVDLLKFNASLTWLIVMGFVTIANFLLLRSWVYSKQ